MSTVYFRCTTTILFYYQYIKADNAFNVNINEGGHPDPHDSFHLGEHAVPNKANSGTKNDDMGGENSSFWNDSSYISK
jgi:hypothetical protein